MTTNNEAFKAYLNKFKHVTGGLRVYSELNEHEKSIAKDAWQAATTEANKRIAVLQASNNYLREALEVVFNNIELFKSMWMRVPTFGDKVNKATRQAISEATSPIFIAFNETQKALTTSQAESLQAHDDEVIEKCAEICYDSYRETDDLHDLSLADSIMALKQK